MQSCSCYIFAGSSARERGTDMEAGSRVRNDITKLRQISKKRSKSPYSVSASVAFNHSIQALSPGFTAYSYPYPIFALVSTT